MNVVLKRLNGRLVSPWDNENPITAEIFGPERFAEHARSLAKAQRAAERDAPVYSIVNRLEDNANALKDVFRQLCASVGKGRSLTPAAEWLIDNFHLVEQHVRHTRLDLPTGFYRQLPKLAEGPLAGHPRIFGLLWAYVAHADSNFDPDSLAHVVNAYQEVQPLTIGELWATPIALRLTLIENLRRISVRMNQARVWREKADEAADRVLASGKTDAVARTLDAALPPQEKIPVPFAVQLLQRFRDLDDGRASSGLNWLQEQVRSAGHSLETIVAHEHQRQGAANVMVRNIMSSMRLISDVNWETWFDGVSQVEALLRGNEVYSDMDFRSRNMYRSAIEQLSRGAERSEIEVARLALEAARHAPGSSGEPGYCLIGKGRGEFEGFLGFKPTLKMRVQRALRSGGLFTYLAPALLIALALIAFVMLGYMRGEPRWWIVAILALVAFFPASEIGFAFVNQAITLLLDARVLPGLAFRNGVDARHRTLVAVPALLTDWQGIDALAERLEVHFLSNGGTGLYFALVTDWSDGDEEHGNSDEAYLDYALTKIAELNVRHATDRFILLHRRRLWNVAQGKWMGWERKRGKLQELNRLLRGDATTSFIVIGGKLPQDIRYVITLDQDTRLPREMAVRMIGKLAHPLNAPRFDEAAGRVAEGYAILQPRVTASLPTGGYGSYYQQLFSAARGIDPYVWAASDVYQDLFDEGSFAGKGIYDIDAFERALKDRVPENAMLSHDLFEGIFARSALLSDVEVIEDYPERHDVSAARAHRWARGDWQLLPWITGARIPGVGLWKMIDNLRRTLVPVAQILTFILGWVLLAPRQASLLSLGVMLSVLLPQLIPAIVESMRIVPELGVRRHFGKMLPIFRQALAVSAANLLLLPAQAALMADAIARTLYRLLVSRRNLLEWTTAAQVQAGGPGSIAQAYMRMWAAPALGAITLAVALSSLDRWYWLLPLAALWLGAPAMAYWMSQPAEIEDELLNSEDDRQSLRRIARMTWRYFETFTNAENNYLPPDNFQEDPNPAIAPRTSPTNIGLYFLSVAAAREFGWINTIDAVSRLEATMAAVGKLEKHRGHLLNWYDTQSLQPLDPRYVSSVDSGNLAGHLVALANYCETWAGEPPSAERACEGIEDALIMVAAELPDGKGKRGAERQALEITQTIESFRRTLRRLREQPDMMAVRLIEIAVTAANLKSACAGMAGAGGGPVLWAEVARFAVEAHFREATASNEQRAGLSLRLRGLAQQARDFAYGMEFGFLFDPRRELLSIGYRVHEGMRDENCYDMLASEARLASFFAVAKGDLPTRHWFKLGRSVTSIRGGAALISWSGSMFEYLMPSLVMRAPSGGLLDQTTKLIVAGQQDYAAKLSVPWGISESAFSGRDTNFTYQYSNFGVPAFGLKRGLAEELVIAPYATGLAAMVAPRRAAMNYAALAAAGAQGIYGYYEALDYTPARLRPGQKVAVVRAYFAHHQGMTIVSLLNALKAGQARTMFHAEASVRATELLLQERAPQDVVSSPASVQQATSAPQAARIAGTPPRSVSAYRGASPATHLLSNGQMAAMMTAAGSGYLTWNDISITRWRQDPTREGGGQFVYVRERGKPQYWSAGHLPAGVVPDSHRVLFSEHKTEFTRRDGTWRTGMECLISAETNAEARSITITNEGFAAREIEITTYAELALAAAQSDAAHPAFSKLFVETEFVPEPGALLATRRRRSESDPQIWVAQMLVVDAPHAPVIEFETDRARFIGRCGDDSTPIAMKPGKTLGRTTGTVLDPVFALRCTLRVPRSRQVRMTLWTMVAATREAVLDLIDQHRQPSAFDRAQMLAWTQAQIQLRHIGIEMEDANNFQELASHVLYPSLSFRPPQSVALRGAGPQSALWAQGVSGDRPIVLLRIDAADDLPVARELIKAFGYWRAKRLPLDLVIVNDRMSSYVQDLQQGLEAAAASLRAITTSSRDGDIFLLRGDLMSRETLDGLVSAARVVLFARHGSLSAQLMRLRAQPAAKPTQPRTVLAPARAPVAVSPPRGLAMFNGFGGFDAARNEYAIFPTLDAPTPAPWTNIIANQRFGLACTADSLGYSWCGNAREMQLTGWSNDPVANQPTEAVYIMDRRTGALASPTLLPLRDANANFEVRHGFGYSRFKSQSADLECDLVQFVARDDAFKVLHLKIANRTSQVKSLSVTYYVEWVLGAQRAQTSQHLVTEYDPATAALMATNRWTPNLTERVAFIAVSGGEPRFTADRREFLGRHGSLAEPAALAPNAKLSNFSGSCADPCGAMQVELTLNPNTEEDVFFFMGAAPDGVAAKTLLAKCRALDPRSALRDVKEHWAEILGAITVKTPDPAMDLMLNGWLLYQSLACRMWGRAGFYQASGAYGYRDQLQDSMSLLYTKPGLARAHILRAAGRQFVEGDVQHWWLPETGNGIRTRFSDDVIWLVYCAARYVAVTGDRSILDENVPFLEGQRLGEHEHELFFLPDVSSESATLFEHCARGLAYSLKFGAHGLPLMGSGDWNDGMNRVGVEGRGESVWLAWFMIRSIKDFALAAEHINDPRVETWLAAVANISAALEKHGWDGQWYRRAFHDDGSILGSAQNAECAIDAIAQSWSVISGAARPQRQKSAMDAVHGQLIDSQSKLAPLFTPPFDGQGSDPGYIAAYPPGIRENGGQYTHGSLWSIFAFAELGDAQRAHELFSLINPANHALTAEDARHYHVEPYVVAADVYGVAPHRGRGGWTWYTGAAGWLYRAGLEAILGFSKRGDTVTLKPCIPDSWQGFEIRIRNGEALCIINVKRGEARPRGKIASMSIKLPRITGEHHFEIVIPRAPNMLPALRAQSDIKSSIAS